VDGAGVPEIDAEADAREQFVGGVTSQAVVAKQLSRVAELGLAE